jgi:hypothetical protein
MEHAERRGEAALSVSCILSCSCPGPQPTYYFLRSQFHTTPISAERNRSTFLGLPEKLTGTGRPPGDAATKESPGSAGRERLHAGSGCGRAGRRGLRSVPAGFRPHPLLPPLCAPVVGAQRWQSLVVAWRASASTQWPAQSWGCRAPPGVALHLPNNRGENKARSSPARPRRDGVRRRAPSLPAPSPGRWWTSPRGAAHVPVP